MRKICALLGGALLLVGGTCFAQDPWSDQYSATTGPDAQKEFAALPENGRAAYKRALIACSLYVDHYYDPDYKTNAKLCTKVLRLSSVRALSACFFATQSSQRT